jgi:hypothetical protein
LGQIRDRERNCADHFPFQADSLDVRRRRGRATDQGALAVANFARTLGEVQDLIGMAIYHLAPASDFCTGRIMYVDGGYTAG